MYISIRTMNAIINSRTMKPRTANSRHMKTFSKSTGVLIAAVFFFLTTTLFPRASNKKPGKAHSIKALQQLEKKLGHLHKKLGKPLPGDWLSVHIEPGQTFTQYLSIKPERATGKRRVLYIQPLGKFTKTENKIINRTAIFMGIYYNLPIKIKKPVPLSEIPGSARRTVYPGNEQLLTSYILANILKPRLPADAAAYIAFTATDLWPGRGWNFVFGQASIRFRVGVYSINRLGNPAKSKRDYRRCLLRSLKIAVHETGHMFSMRHCIRYECNMCGSNNLQESDRYPLSLCPVCLAKTCYATGADPAVRYKKLASFYKANNLNILADFCRRSIKALD